jgi:hypothetical protein
MDDAAKQNLCSYPGIIRVVSMEWALCGSQIDDKKCIHNVAGETFWIATTFKDQENRRTLKLFSET